MTVFRQYRCYDDFEKAALHGTFVIDAKGRVRWQDISYEPFMDVDFLLKEAVRLITFDAESTVSSLEAGAAD
jgi:alkyl hydroperoxide reductase subunit AhpC